MRMETPDGNVVENPSVDAMAEAVRSLAGTGAATLVGNDDPQSYMRATGGPREFALEYRDELTQRRFVSGAGQDEDTAIRVMKSYLQGKTDYKHLTPWREITVEPGKVSEWSDPMPDQVNRGGCISVLAIVALLGAAAWCAVSVA
jgi:hypothetical protein